MDEEHSSSDGGAVLLKGVDRSLGLTEALAGCLRDPRQAGKIAHTFRELVQQRIFAIATSRSRLECCHQTGSRKWDWRGCIGSISGSLRK